MPDTKALPLLIIGLCLALSGCSGLKIASAPPVHPRGELFASIKISRSAFPDLSRDGTGYFFYAEPDYADPFADKASHLAQPLRLTAYSSYKVEHGVVLVEHPGHASSTKILGRIHSINLEPFDFAAEVAAVTKQLRENAEKTGEFFIGPPAVLDGEKFEITILTGNGRFTMDEWNPGPVIEEYAQHSPQIAKLKAVLDLLTQYYGRIQLGL